ncbi:hypothetical protein PQX77_022362 [Marasmius sp. AFHP31]|nr:hypothetical protein PQX77_022362 [Marasmius sp. AFHP31]
MLISLEFTGDSPLERDLKKAQPQMNAGGVEVSISRCFSIAPPDVSRYNIKGAHTRRSSQAHLSDYLLRASLHLMASHKRNAQKIPPIILLAFLHLCASRFYASKLFCQPFSGFSTLLMTQTPSSSPSYSVEEYTKAEIEVFDQIMENVNVPVRSSTPIDPTTSAPATRHSSSSPSKRPLRLKEGAVAGLHRVAEQRAQSAAEEQAQAQSISIAQPPAEDKSRLRPAPGHQRSVSPGPFGPHPTTHHPLQHPSYPTHSVSPIPPVAHPNHHPPRDPSHPPHSTSPGPLASPFAAHPNFSASLHPTSANGYPYPPPYLQAYGFYNPHHPAHPQHMPGASSSSSTVPTTPTPATTSAPPTISTTRTEPAFSPVPAASTVASSAAQAQVSNILLSPRAPAAATPTTPAQVSNELPATTTTSPTDQPPSSQNSEHAAGAHNVDEGATEGLDEEDSIFGSEGLPGLDDACTSDESPSPGGRPSKTKMDACDRICKKLGDWLVAESEAAGVELSTLYERLGGKMLRAQRRKSRWNGYQSFATHPTHMAVELGRLKDSDVPWDGTSKPTTRQLGVAYRLYIKEKGQDQAKSLMDVWNMMREIEAVQKKGERKRTFKAAVDQLKNFAEYLRNRYNIHLWAIIAGGQIWSDQLYTFVCGLHESAGFAKGALAVGEDDIGELFQAWIFNRNAAKFTNQQIAAMAHERGLTVTGPGIDEETASPSKSAPSEIRSSTRTSAPAKKNVRDLIRAAVKRRFDECLDTLNKSFKVASNLPWSTLASECVELGLQITNYPRGIYYPWTEVDRAGKASKTNRGIRNIPQEHQLILVDACEEGHKHRLTIVNADPIQLENNLIPVLVTAPDEKGKTIEFFAKDIVGCLEGIKSSLKKKVKFEEAEGDLTASGSRPTLNRSAKTKAKPDYGDKDLEAVGSDSEVSQSEEETPKPSKGGGSRSSTQARRKQKSPGTPSPEKGPVRPTKGGRQLTSPFAAMGNKQSAPSASVSTKKVITIDEFHDGAFVPDPALPKRASDSVATGEGPPTKRPRQDARVIRPTPVSKPAPPTSSPASGPQPHVAETRPPVEVSPMSTSPREHPQWQQQLPAPYQAQYPHPQYAIPGPYHNQFAGQLPPTTSSPSFHSQFLPHLPPSATSHMQHPVPGVQQQPPYPGHMPEALQAQMAQLLQSFYMNQQQPASSAQQTQAPPPSGPGQQ